ncbi:MAG: DinB family protein [Pirellulaceae bacterium]
MSYNQRPGDHECFDYHRDYVAQVPDGNILETLEVQQKEIPLFIAQIDSAQWEIIHAPYGWAVRTVIEHCCDAERVFGYRILRFATGDKTDLPGWDENHYADCGYATQLSPVELAGEFAALRASNLHLLKRIKPEAFEQLGTADGRGVSVRTLAWLMAGHWMHHEAILKKRLGP